MSILAKKEIIDLINKKQIEFNPQLDGFQIQPHSIDLRLGYTFYIPRKWTINEKGRMAAKFDYLDINSPQDNFDLIKLKPKQYFEILPKEFIIASSLERIVLNKDNIMARLNARSSFLRRGLSISSGIIDVRYKGILTFPITNNTDTQTIKLYPGERICHIIFEKISSPISEEEAKIHGLKEAKYLESTPYGLENRSDSEEEIYFIKDGKLSDLKEKYKI